MVFEDLKENYTKVSYKKRDIAEVGELKKTTPNNWRKTVIRVGVTSAFLLFGLDTTAFAESNGLGQWAEELYYGKFIDIAKWLIILKCGWDAVSRSLKEDFGGMKRSVISAGLTYVVLTGLPWAFNEVDSIFRG